MRGGLTVLATLTIVIVCAAQASAGTMTVFSCHTPSGRSAATMGWSVVASGAPTQLRTANDCASGPRGTLIARIGGTGAKHGSEHLAWRFQAAPGSSVSSFTAAVCARALTWDALASVAWDGPPGGQNWVFVSTFDQPRSLGCNGTPPWSADSSNVVARQGISSGWVDFHTSCYMGGCPELDGVVSDIEVSSFRAEIHDAAAPTVAAVRGPLATNASHAGTEAVIFDAADTGVGVFRGIVEARINRDGPWRELTSTIVSQTATCIPLRESANLYEFDSPRPCSPSVADASVALDNSVLPEGVHELRVVVEDAAGNRTDVMPARVHYVAPRATTTAASAAPAPAPAIAQLRITTPKRPRLARSAAFQLTGRLTDEDARPIPHGAVLIQSRVFLPKAARSEGPWTTLGQVVSDADGVFRARIPRGPSRSLLLTYRASPDDPVPAATVQTDVVVPARVSVRAKRTHVRNGRPVVLIGRVAGPIPPGGVLVAMEVREPGRWIPVATTRRWVRTNIHGSFRLSYRFLRTFRPTTYRFRVVADEDSAFQYDRGASRSVDIHVRP